MTLMKIFVIFDSLRLNQFNWFHLMRFFQCIFTIYDTLLSYIKCSLFSHFLRLLVSVSFLVVDSFETLLPLYSANCWVLLAFASLQLFSDSLCVFFFFSFLFSFVAFSICLSTSASRGGGVPLHFLLPFCTRFGIYLSV